MKLEGPVRIKRSQEVGGDDTNTPTNELLF